MVSPNHPQDAHPRPEATPFETIQLRLATPSDALEIGRVASSAYSNASLTHFLYPHRLQHPKCYLRGTQQRSLARVLEPRNVTVLATIPRLRNGSLVAREELVGFIVMQRSGDDAGAKRQMAGKASVWLWLLTWLLWAAVKAWNVLLGGDKSESAAAWQALMDSFKRQGQSHWDAGKFPERQNRWHALSVAVAPEHQGKGVGKLLIGEAMRRAQEEGVCVGLEANVDGKPLYRRVGFELLGRFDIVLREEERDRGGVMIWRPEGWVEGKGISKSDTAVAG